MGPLDHDTRISAMISETYAWLTRALGQIQGECAWELDLGSDPMETLRALNAIQGQLEARGVPVPSIVDLDADPIGNMIGLRDFLAKLVTVH